MAHESCNYYKTLSLQKTSNQNITYKTVLLNISSIHSPHSPFQFTEHVTAANTEEAHLLPG